ncbi:hypothetical protein NSQ40_08585 [Bacillus sp. FSL K6-6038]|uniref:hypothetical protein n=1 Tax=Bacillus TaxID=1386 RepID=UPI00215A467E|nr:hypothetical protein [Bacillus pseudomycoides]MCR8861021.1 hypothetical protein [Bacillus pseudomycoides]
MGGFFSKIWDDLKSGEIFHLGRLLCLVIFIYYIMNSVYQLSLRYNIILINKKPIPQNIIYINNKILSLLNEYMPLIIVISVSLFISGLTLKIITYFIFNHDIKGGYSGQLIASSFWLLITTIIHYSYQEFGTYFLTEILSGLIWLIIFIILRAFLEEKNYYFFR